MRTIKKNIIFLTELEKGREDAKLRLRVRWGSEIASFSVGYRINQDKWNKETQRCVTNTSHGRDKVPAAIINKEIQRLSNLVEDIFEDYQRQDIIPTAQDFRDEFNIRNGKKTRKRKSFFDYYDDFVASKENKVTRGSMVIFGTARRHLYEFAPELEFEDLNEDGLNLYVDYLLGHAGGDVELRNTTAKKNIKVLTGFLRWAHQRGYHNQTAYITFKPKLKIIPKKVIFLSWTELMQVWEYEIPKEKQYLQRAKDKFLFCCFTSLRYSDMDNLKWSDVYDDHIEITTVKTGDPLRIELNKYSSEILSHYTRTDGYVFSRISNQKMNSFLKELGKLCGINTLVTLTYYKGVERVDEVVPKYELLTTHVGRRTFVCNALMLGIPPEIVMKWTGHTDYNAMKPYIAIADEAKKDAMQLFNK